MHIDDVTELVFQIADELGTHITFGYTGNCSPLVGGFDDRSWAVWFHDLPRGVGSIHSDNVPSLLLGWTARVEELSEFQVRTLVKRRFAHLSDLAASRRVS